MIYTHHYRSPLGMMTMASDGRSLTGLWFDGQKYFPDAIGSGSEEAKLPVFDEAVRWLDAYFSGMDPGTTPEISVDGSPFRVEVWDILRTIPYGETMTYGDIAAMIAKRRGISRMSSQAVGGAVGHNPVSIMIPCHRVIGADGSLTRYAGGTERKAELLALERSVH